MSVASPVISFLVTEDVVILCSARLGERDAGHDHECPPFVHGWTNVGRVSLSDVTLTQNPSSFVMYNYTWDVGVGDYSKYGDNIIPAQIPISVYAKGNISCSAQYTNIEPNVHLCRAHSWRPLPSGQVASAGCICTLLQIYMPSTPQAKRRRHQT